MVTSYQGQLQAPTRAEYPRVGSFMSKSFVQVGPDDDIYQVMSLVLNENTGGALVVNNFKLLGIISEQNLLKLAFQDSYASNSVGGPASAYMNADYRTLTPDHGLDEVTELFLNGSERKFPVIDHGKLVGVVRRTDVLKVVEDFYRRRLQFLRDT